MCTLIALHRSHPRVPLFVAANRDEYLDRPASAPALGEHGGRRVLAPRDLRAGGTWLGLNDCGVFAALTNRPNPSPDASLRSRGLLVLDALSRQTAGQAAEALAALPPRAYNPFNLFVSDGAEAFVAIYQDRPRVTELAPGVHVIGNADPDDRSTPKVARLLDAAERVAAGRREWWLEGFAALCRGHEGDGPLGAACVHHGGYGTRSCTLLQIDGDPARSELRFSEGPPCRTDLRNLTPLLHELPHPGVAADGGAQVGSLR
jgi:uncharacterized protein with NRDE domain